MDDDTGRFQAQKLRMPMQQSYERVHRLAHLRGFHDVSSVNSPSDVPYVNTDTRNQSSFNVPPSFAPTFWPDIRNKPPAPLAYNASIPPPMLFPPIPPSFTNVSSIPMNSSAHSTPTQSPAAGNLAWNFPFPQNTSSSDTRLPVATNALHVELPRFVPPSIEDEIDDAKWVKLWSERRRVHAKRDAAKQKQHRTKVSSCKIFLFKSKLRQGFTLIERLREMCAERGFSNHCNDSRGDSNDSQGGYNESEKFSLPHCTSLKKELEVYLSELCKPEAIGEMKTALAKRQQKRMRLKRARNENWLIAKGNAELKAARHAIIDTWQLALQQQIIDRKKEDEWKKMADETLGEVRHKTQEATKAKLLVQGLMKLRTLRKEEAEKRGLYTTEDCDVSFERKCQEMLAVLNKQLETYEQEETTLKVMLDAEQKESFEREVASRQALQTRQAEQHARALRQWLFGTDDAQGHDDELSMFRAFYEQAAVSLPALIQIRHSWDAYLASSDSPGASRIPTSWVMPEEPSSKVWASALH